MPGAWHTCTQPAKAPLQLKITVAQSATIIGSLSERNSFAASARWTPMMSPSCAAPHHQDDAPRAESNQGAGMSPQMRGRAMPLLTDKQTGEPLSRRSAFFAPQLPDERIPDTVANRPGAW